MDIERRFKLRFMRPQESCRVSELVNALQLYQNIRECPRLPSSEDLLNELTHTTKEGVVVGNNFGTFVVVAIDLNRLDEPNNAGVIGYLIYTQGFCILNGRHFYMNSFFIQEGYRHHGLGTKFIKFMKLHGLSVGVSRVDIPFMNNNTIGQKFYKRFGSFMVNEEYEIMKIRVNDLQ